MTVAIISAASIGLLIFVLGFLVSLARTRSKVITGVGGPTEFLTKAVRAHANSAEYAPVIMVLMLVVGVANEARMVEPFAPLNLLMIAIAASRYLHAAGFLFCETLEKPHALKAIGAVVTYVGGVILSVAAIAAVLAPR